VKLPSLSNPTSRSKEIAQRVGTVPFDRRTEADGGARCLAHLGAFPLHVAVRPDQVGQRETAASSIAGQMMQ